MGTRVMDEETPHLQSSPNRRYYIPQDTGSPGASSSGHFQQTSRQAVDPQERRKKEQIDQLKNFVGLGIGLSSVFTEYVFSHPCIVMRRQCQVKSEGGWYHLTPFTVFPVVFNIAKHQGLPSIWKGIGSTFVARGIFMVSETVISEVTPFPKSDKTQLIEENRTALCVKMYRSHFDNSILCIQFCGDCADQLKNFVGLGIGLSSVFTEYVFSHPCIVMRRQCQVKSEGGWYHLTPFTVFPVVFNIAKHQGLPSIWKGIGSTFVARGIFMVSETVISEVTPFPKEVTRHSSLKKIGQHFVLKCIAHTLTTPFYASSFVETVQSDIASERPGVLDCVKEGVTRVMGWGLPQSTRLLPVWKLILPVLGYKLSHYVITSIAQYTVMSAVKVEQRERQSSQEHLVESTRTPSRSMYDKYFPELLAAFTGNLLADVMLYPVETVMHRLFIQGTRTILDNVDYGLGVLPIHTRYEGPFDCLKCIITEEGLMGLYKGFGALVLQYCIHAAILKTVKFLFEQMSDDRPPDRHRQQRQF